MKMAANTLVACLTLLLAASCMCASTKAAVTPVQKVVEMLSAMLEKAKASKHDEEVEWTAFKQWCGDAEADKQNAVKAANRKVEMLEASIEQHKADAEALGKAIEKSEADIVGYKASIKQAIEDRAAQNKIYKEKELDYDETLKALAQAIAVLKKQAFDRPQSSALLQAMKGHLPESARKAIDSFLALGSDSADLAFVTAPEANAYEFQSSEIVDLLEKLKVKFTEERTDLQKTELNQLHAHESLLMDLKNSITEAERMIARDSGYKTEHETASAEESGELTDVTTTRADDNKFLMELSNTCKMKSSDFAERAKLRAEEIEALSKALEIISAQTVAGAAEKYMPTMMIQRGGAALVQLRSSSPDAQRRHALTYLKDAATRLRSHTLAAIAVQVQELQDQTGPFDKVIKMIKDLISKLEAQESEEAKHKSWCDTELQANENTRTTKTEEVDTLSSDIDELSSQIQQAKKSVAALSKGVAETQAKLAEATKMRNEESDENDKTVIDADEGLNAITEAIKILKDFYDKAADATALVQGGSQAKQEPPPIFKESYKGMQTEGTNVLAFLDVIKSNFMRLKSETEKAEADAKAEYDALVTSSNEDITQKKKQIQDLNNELQTKETTLSTKKTDLSNAQAELSSALEYFDKLKPSCVAVSTPMSYSTRVQHREEEIEALQEALKILNGEFEAGPDGMYSSTEGGNRGWDVAQDA